MTHRVSPGKNTGVGCYAFLQGIFQIQGSELGSLALQVDTFNQGSPAAAAAAAAAAKSIQSCPTLCDPIDGSPPSSPVPGILKARTLEWFAISFSKV